MQTRSFLYLLSAVALLQFGAQLVLQWGVDPSSLFRPLDARNMASDWDYRYGYGVCAASFPLIEAIMFGQFVQATRCGPISLRPLFITFAFGNILFCILSLAYSETVPVLLDLPALVLLVIAIAAPRGGYQSVRQIPSAGLQQPCAGTMS